MTRKEIKLKSLKTTGTKLKIDLHRCQETNQIEVHTVDATKIRLCCIDTIGNQIKPWCIYELAIRQDSTAFGCSQK